VYYATSILHANDETIIPLLAQIISNLRTFLDHDNLNLQTKNSQLNLLSATIALSKVFSRISFFQESE
jgi:hypothetical protein